MSNESVFLPGKIRDRIQDLPESRPEAACDVKKLQTPLVRLRSRFI